MLERIVLNRDAAMRLATLAKAASALDPGYVARTANGAALDPMLDRFVRIADVSLTEDMKSQATMVLAGYRDPNNPTHPTPDATLQAWTEGVCLHREEIPFAPDIGDNIELWGRFAPLRRERQTDGRVAEVDPGAGLNETARRSIYRAWLCDHIVRWMKDAGQPAMLVHSTIEQMDMRTYHRRSETAMHEIRQAEITTRACLKVHDPDRLMATLAEGRGRQKAFGLGVMVPTAALKEKDLT